MFFVQKKKKITQNAICIVQNPENFGVKSSRKKKNFPLVEEQQEIFHL